MGILNKLMFWKKEDSMPDIGKDMDFGNPPDLGMGGAPGQPGQDMSQGYGGMPGSPEHAGAGGLGMPDLNQEQSFPETPSRPFNAPRLEESGASRSSLGPQSAAAPSSTEYISNKDLEIISLKLDSLKTTLEAINARIARLEKIAEGEEESSRARF